MSDNCLARNDEVEKVFLDFIEQSPEEGEAHYSLGLLLAEIGKLEEAHSSLAAAVRLLPNRPRVRYNYALILQHLGLRAEAERVLRAAHELGSADPDIVYALAVFYVQERQWDQALFQANKLRELLPPGAPGPPTVDCPDQVSDERRSAVTEGSWGYGRATLRVG